MTPHAARINYRALCQEPKRLSIPWLEIVPLLIFFVAFQVFARTRPGDALLLSAGVFALAATTALLFGLWKTRHPSKVLLASTAAIVGSAALAFSFDDPRFFLVRPTVINGGLGLVLLGSLAVGRNAARSALGRQLRLPDRMWTVLAFRFGLFFLAVALTNELVWRTQTHAVWVGVKTFGFTPLTALLAMAHLPHIRSRDPVRQESVNPAGEVR